MAEQKDWPGSTEAVVIIDMQNDFVRREGAVVRYFGEREDGRDLDLDEGLTGMEAMVPRLVAFIAAAREKDVPVIWVRTVNDENTRSSLAAAQGKCFAGAADEWGTAFHEGLVPNAEEPVLTKHRHSAFFGTALDLILRTQEVVTVADCTASKVTREHDEALHRLGRTFGRVSDAAEIIEEWRTF